MDPFLDFELLLPGQLYRVVHAFRDSSGREHRPGEQWVFLGCTERTDASSVCLQVTEGGQARTAIELSREERPSTLGMRLRTWLALVSDLPEGHEPACACPGKDADWAVLFRAGGLEIVSCFGCGLVVAFERGAHGDRAVPMDQVQRAAVLRVNHLPFRAPLLTVLETASECSLFPATLMIANLLERRRAFPDELADALRSREDRLRLAALRFVAAYPSPPTHLEARIVGAFRASLAASPASPETLWALRALDRVAERVPQVGLEVAAARQILRDDRSDLAQEIRSTAQGVLRKMHAEADREARHRAAAVGVLRTLAIRRAYEEADSWLESLELGPGSRVLIQASLCEAAGDSLAHEHERAARWCYRQALGLYREYASRSQQGEGATRMRHVRRVARRLGIGDEADEARSGLQSSGDSAPVEVYPADVPTPQSSA